MTNAGVERNGEKIMNLSKLKADVNHAVEHAEECGESPDDITVSIQVDTGDSSVYSDDVALHYDNDCQASGCVIVGVAPDAPDPAEHFPCKSFVGNKTEHGKTTTIRGIKYCQRCGLIVN